MVDTEVIGRYMPGWSYQSIHDMPIRVRRYWAQTAVYRLKGNRGG